jgi:hypothetical protein
MDIMKNTSKRLSVVKEEIGESVHKVAGRGSGVHFWLLW